ncbi:LuxR family transcriptional regulator [Streptomyces sp. TRM49041]|uniref:helix-turn-helix transcriptional regulator n=1 Tax=Streptomyces sp. TRM49041 TaxID=2603216 RepID=UPI0011EEC711|nr:LuxR family transcriptional regulator [Streptomyces sp. TRM49041]
MPGTGTGPLRERREALELVAAEAERAARTGGGRLVLLRGATGTGRTALLEAVTEQASARGMRVRRARCSPEDHATPFAAVLKLIDPGPELSRLTDELPGPPCTPRKREYAARLWDLARSYAAGSPLLLAVDDVHLADAASHRWLSEAARRIDRLPVLLVVTERSQYDIDLPPPGLAHTLSPALVRSHTLAPLSPDAAADLVRAATGPGRSAPREWVHGCVRAGASSPLLLGALLEDLLDDLRAWEPADGAPPTVPDTCAALYPGAYPAAVSWWLDSAGPATAAVARALAAVDGDPWCDGRAEYAELLAEMAGADAARVPGWLTAMTRLGLLVQDPDGRPRYAHPLLRDAVLNGWSSDRRQAAHRAAAEVLLRRGQRAETVAGQLLRTPAVGAVWATDVLLDAAAVALRDGRAEEAMGFLHRALDEPMPSARRAAVLVELGSLEFAVVRPTAGIPRLAEAVRLSETPQDRMRASVALSTALASRGEARAAIDVLRDLDEHLAGDQDLIRTARSASALLSDHDRGVRQEVYHWFRETARRSPHLVGTAGQALLVRYASTAGLTSADAAMGQIRALLEEPGDALGEPFLLGTAAAVATWADELDEAERLVRRGLARQSPSLLHPMHKALLNVRLDIAAARGAYAELLADPDVWKVPEAGAVRTDPSNAHAHAVVALVETGRTGEARLLADSFDVRDSHDSWELNRFLYARGVLRAASDDPAGALDDFLECGRRQSAREVVSPVVTPWRTAAAVCRLLLDRPREALAATQEELRLGTVWNTPRVVGRALRVLGSATGGRPGLDLAERAVRTLRDASVDTELVPALVAHGRQLTAAGERARARDSLREAAERAERLGWVRLRAMAEDALRESGARRSGTTLTGTGALTGSEHRIAALAADGLTNTEIAELLHLARRTVETHLTSTYRKLGIRGRTALTAALGRRP